MPAFSLPRDSYEANERLGERQTMILPGEMALARYSPRSIVLRYRANELARYHSDGSLTLCQPEYGRDGYGRVIPLRGWRSRAETLLPLDWEFEFRPTHPRWGSRSPDLLYCKGYRIRMEQDVTFVPDGSIKQGPYPTSRAELEMAVMRSRSNDRDYSPPVPPALVLPEWAGRDPVPADPPPSPRRGLVRPVAARTEAYGVGYETGLRQAQAYMSSVPLSQWVTDSDANPSFAAELSPPPLPVLDYPAFDAVAMFARAAYGTFFEAVETPPPLSTPDEE